MSTCSPRHPIVLLLLCAAIGCADVNAAEQCSATAPSECLEPELRYVNVAPLFERHCAVCHTGAGNQPWPLDSYENIADWEDLVREELAGCTMPPPGSAEPLGNGDRARILSWLRCGLPQ